MTTTSTWADAPIQLTESLNDAIWSGAGKMPIPNGFLLTKNDAQYLYAALDMTGDTVNNSGVDDYFWFTFDRNRDGNITPNVDVNYGQYPATPNKIGRQFYLAPGTWTGLSTDQTEFKVDFEASPNSATPHRVWKFKFKLTDLNVSLIPFILPPYTRFGIRVHSTTPLQDNSTPANFWTSFASLHTLYFSRRPSVPVSLMGPVIGCVGLIPTTKINAASGKATTDVGYMVQVQNAAFGGLLNIIGNGPNLDNLIAVNKAAFIKVKHRTGTAGTFTDLITSWNNYRWNSVANDYTLVNYSPDTSNFYPLPTAGVDYSIHDLLFQFNSYELSQGLHQFQVEFYTATKASITLPTIQTLTLYIDNTVPIVKINSIKHGGVAVNTCEIVKMTSGTDGLVINFDANDPENNVHSYAVTATWGEGQSATIISDTYTPAKGDWGGVTNQNAPASGVWVPLVTCAHSFNVTAWARTTNGYGYIGYNSVSRYLTILK
ncbi:hypothetical protein SAMN05421788_10667 [Filimonas lacunae]|uniref:Uncharacterized protein n=1 Tax=Filimonas lacunae TaxID=477680 RepID=A0A173MEG8_9BACT|nr:hypothetical protein [Filimonas lacunae]BAV05993.1 hypothetical protein FLA_2008 [Filimonas lacunae]SIT24096.1 hypothetical protein SAMN05421788_10667 [Filimonas lacunae]